ncbi:MAG: hypothetical protein OIN86_11985 [Candidatus Methanoperedens sp.]|nr:hypothetical protein [Candidatus Methanoperedens sp.]CAG1003795.1 hypothetical protein METP1_03101 [Methanosarcinales archaeon]
MNEKIELSSLKEMVSILKEIRDKLSAAPSGGGTMRGPVADPAPGWNRMGIVADPAPPWGKTGIIADPAPEYGILGKEKLAKLKIRRLDMAISELESQIELLKLQKEMLEEEYK